MLKNNQEKNNELFFKKKNEKYQSTVFLYNTVHYAIRKILSQYYLNVILISLIIHAFSFFFQ